MAIAPLRPDIEKAIDKVIFAIEDIICAEWNKEQIENLRQALRSLVVATKH